MWIPTEHEKYGVGKFVFNSSRDSERLLLLLNQCNVTTYTVCLFVFVSDAGSACFCLYMFGKETSVSVLSLSN